MASLPMLIEICGFEKITIDEKYVNNLKLFTFDIPMMSGP